MERTRVIERFGMGLLTALAVCCALVLGLLAIQVARDLRAVADGNTDNVQWSLSQAEVEFLEFQAAVNRARHSPTPDLAMIRQEFDIFYSRVVTLEDGQIYAALRARPEFDTALTEVRGFLDATVGLIDADDTALAAALAQLADQSDGIRAALRTVSVHGLTQFALVIDAQRNAISRTLMHLAIVTLALVGALGLLAWYSHRVSRQAVHHGRELAEARDLALAGDKAKSDFLAMMSHEIRTPLNGILGNVALLEDSALDSDQARYVRNMGISGRVLMEHVDSVLDLTRFATGKIVLSEEPVNVAHLLQDIVDGQESHAQAQDTRLSWEWVGSPAGWLSFDRPALQQILLNFVSNALKFTPQGTVRVEAEHDASEREIEFRVIDTGRGIAEADLPRVFDDFHTTDTSFDRTTGGTGLGLGIARRLAGALGGRIGAESTLGEGSVFWVRLPAIPARSRSVVRPKAAPQTGRDGLSILVVEDNEINLDVTCDMIRRLGHRVSVARTGAEGAAKATSEAYDLILMDIAMPEMDGIAATCAIRASNGASANAPIVALSANVLPKDRARFLAAGMSDVLTKPLRKARLLKVLADIGHDAGPASASDSDDIPETLRQRFVDEISDLLDWLDGNPADHPQIAARCHQAAGSAAAFGEARLHKALNAVETAISKGESAAHLGDRIRGLRILWSENRVVAE